MKSKLLVIAAIFLSWAATAGLASAYSKRLESIDALFREADIIASLTVRSTDGHFVGKTECGVLYQGIVTRVFKGGTLARIDDGSTLTFGRAKGLKPGREYLLFIRYVSDLEHELDKAMEKLRREFPGELSAGSEGLSKQEGLAIISCGGLLPGYQYVADAAWPIEYGGCQFSAFGRNRRFRTQFT
jgi:hypothetical protein